MYYYCFLDGVTGNVRDGSAVWAEDAEDAARQFAGDDGITQIVCVVPVLNPTRIEVVSKRTLRSRVLP